MERNGQFTAAKRLQRIDDLTNDCREMLDIRREERTLLPGVGSWYRSAP